MSLKLQINIQTRPGYIIDRKVLRKKLIDEFKKWVAGQGSYQITVVLVGNRKIRQLKRDFLGKDEVTDVLSFPLASLEDAKEDVDEAVMLGDIVISYPQAKQQAYQNNKRVMDEVVELAKHGLRHLLGIHHN
ncbi:MAG: rRNA maturation RNase YbeY [bacterium]|nr:rRNA maturation RNase YbeY [bacterium]